MALAFLFGLITTEMKENQQHSMLNSMKLSRGGGGLDVKWYGGLTNAICGIEISGPESPEKIRIMKAFKAAKIKFTNVQYTDAPASEHSPLNAVGVSVSIGRSF